jgi:hypothetical protein
MSAITRIVTRLNEQRSQTLVIFAAAFAIITIAGFIVVDFGLWFSERRGAQTDADLPALAGARECMLQLATGASRDPYNDGILPWFNNNNGGNAELVAARTSTQCFDPTTGGACGPHSPFCCVDVVVKHTSRTMFSGLPLFHHAFDDVAGNIGAHARACAGAANNPGGYLPVFSATNGPCFMTDEQTPNLGGICPIKFDSSGTPETGLLDLLNGGACSQWSGSASIQDNMENGTGGMCLISDTPDGGSQSCDPADSGSVKDGPWYECVAAKGGNNAGPAMKGLNDRLTKPNDCGSNFDDVITEVAPGVYEPKDCDSSEPGVQPSPRLVTIFVLKEAPSTTGGNDKGEPIVGFAGFYIEGCGPDAIGAETGAQCANNVDDDGDGKVNDGCPSHGGPEAGSDCNNSSDDDGDGDINDGCPAVAEPADLNLTPQQRVCGAGGPGQQLLYGRFLTLTMAGSGTGPVDPSSTEFGIALVDWEGGGGTPGPTSVPTPGSPTDTPAPPPTVAPTTPPPSPTPQCPPQCVLPNGKCKNNCP